MPLILEVSGPKTIVVRGTYGITKLGVPSLLGCVLGRFCVASKANFVWRRTFARLSAHTGSAQWSLYVGEMVILGYFRFANKVVRGTYGISKMGVRSLQKRVLRCF